MDEELTKLLNRIASRMLREKSLGKGKAISKKIELDIIGVDSPHGIYIYDRGEDKWVLSRSDGSPYVPVGNGFYVMYFDNTKCPACRIYDLAWYPATKILSNRFKDLNFIIILCEWFSSKCRSEAASRSFNNYSIHASPTTILLYVKNHRILREERFEGARDWSFLITKIKDFIRRCREENNKTES